MALLDPRRCAVRMATVLLWQYFADCVKVVSLKELEFETYMREDLEKHKFSNVESSSIYDIYMNNIIGKEITDFISDETMHKLIAYLVWSNASEKKRNDAYNIYDALREYDIESRSNTALSIHKFYTEDF